MLERDGARSIKARGEGMDVRNEGRMSSNGPVRDGMVLGSAWA